MKQWSTPARGTSCSARRERTRSGASPLSWGVPSCRRLRAGRSLAGAARGPLRRFPVQGRGAVHPLAQRAVQAGFQQAELRRFLRLERSEVFAQFRLELVLDLQEHRALGIGAQDLWVDVAFAADRGRVAEA